ncbi:putative serine incorporator/TMS membrane protein [Helianthus annuus]|nr:putative serine incorporator/TMS membrane protein [Helianthus annuus]
MFVSTAGTSKLHGRKELWHSGWWSAKLFLMFALIVLPFFLPTEMILIYG